LTLNAPVVSWYQIGLGAFESLSNLKMKKDWIEVSHITQTYAINIAGVSFCNVGVQAFYSFRWTKKALNQPLQGISPAVVWMYRDRRD
jgi:hypothetical protein